MLNPKYKNYSERIKSLIDEGNEVAALERTDQYGNIRIFDEVRLRAWLVKVKTIVESTFGKESPHHEQMLETTNRHVHVASQVQALVGLLIGALDDLENGFLIGQEFIVAGIVFDSILEQAKHLNNAGHKDPSAILARIVLEDSLKRIASSLGMDTNKKVSQINDDLKKVGRYPQPQWRQIQAWLDIGNSAAHGNFEDYNQEGVENLIENIEQFLAVELRT